VGDFRRSLSVRASTLLGSAAALVLYKDYLGFEKEDALEALAKESLAN